MLPLSGPERDLSQVVICLHYIFENAPQDRAQKYLLPLNGIFDDAIGSCWTRKTCQNKTSLIESDSGLNVLMKTNAVLEKARTWVGFAADIELYRNDFEQLRAYASYHAFGVLEYVLRETNIRKADILKLKKIIIFVALLYQEVLILKDSYQVHSNSDFPRLRMSLDETLQSHFDWIMKNANDVTSQMLEALDSVFRNNLRRLIAMAFSTKSILLTLINEKYSDTFLDQRFWSILVDSQSLDTPPSLIQPHDALERSTLWVTNSPRTMPTRRPPGAASGPTSQSASSTVREPTPNMAVDCGKEDIREPDLQIYARSKPTRSRNFLGFLPWWSPRPPQAPLTARDLENERRRQKGWRPEYHHDDDSLKRHHDDKGLKRHHDDKGLTRHDDDKSLKRHHNEKGLKRQLRQAGRALFFPLEKMEKIEDDQLSFANFLAGQYDSGIKHKLETPRARHELEMPWTRYELEIPGTAKRTWN